MNQEQKQGEIARANELRAALETLIGKFREDGHAEDSRIVTYLCDIQAQIDAWLANPTDPQLRAELTNVMMFFNERADTGFRRGKA